MHRIAPLFVTLLLFALFAPVAAAQPTTNFCPPGQQPRFEAGFATLKERLGARMGNPLECEHPDPQTGDSLAHTTTGLAFYRQSTNTASFTNGFDHWAMMPRGLGHWTGSSIDPPTLTFDDIRFLDDVAPLAAQEGDLGTRLRAIALNAEDPSPEALADLSAIRAELADINDQLSVMVPGPNTASLLQTFVELNGGALELLDLLGEFYATPDDAQKLALARRLLELTPVVQAKTADLYAELVVLGP